MSIHLVRGDDPILRDQAVSRLVDELLGDADRTMALEVNDTRKTLEDLKAKEIEPVWARSSETLRPRRDP